MIVHSAMSWGSSATAFCFDVLNMENILLIHIPARKNQLSDAVQVVNLVQNNADTAKLSCQICMAGMTVKNKRIRDKTV